MKDTHRHLHGSAYMHRHTQACTKASTCKHTHTHDRAAYPWGVVTATEQIRAC